MADPHRVERVSSVTSTNLATLVDVATAADDSNLEEPMGVEPKAWRSIARTIEVENIGDEPLEGVRLVVNGRDLTDVRGLLDHAHAGTVDAVDPLALFRAWTELRVHGESGTPENASPLHALACFGHTSEKSDSVALFRLFSSLGVPVRFVLLKGHEAIEAMVGGGPALFDGDREVFYTRLDGELASYADLMKDPLLALRAKPFGRGSRYDLKRSWAAATVFEPVVTSSAPMASGRQELHGVEEGFVLFPGETLRFDLQHAPSHAAGVSPISAEIREAVLRTIELEVDSELRSKTQNPVTVKSPFPVLELRSRDDTSPITSSPFVRSVVLDPSAGRTTLVMQASRFVMPRLRKGQNVVLVESTRPGPVKVTVTYGPNDRAPPVATLEVETATGPTLVPSATERFQRVHWQVARDSAFSQIDPTLDVVEPYTGKVALSAMERTHFLPGRTYFVRVRVAAKDRWSPFSNVVEFVDTKPATPTLKGILVSGEETRIELEPQKGVTFHVFGSDRRDFVPDVYSNHELVELAGADVKTATVSNRLASVDAGASLTVPTRRFFRVVAELAGSISVPTALIDSNADRPASELRVQSLDPLSAKVVSLSR
ncbi:MAG: hypothetical protein HY791_10750 [Deltaproteobacteria bacterium]|nr:hypothetical protein [Deltaproteobacteria bacterium]